MVEMKDKDVHIRFSQSELDTLSERAGRMNLSRSAYIRYAACETDSEIVKTHLELHAFLKSIRYELIKQGINLNQVVKLFNTYKAAGGTFLPSLISVTEKLDASLDAINCFRERLEKETG